MSQTITVENPAGSTSQQSAARTESGVTLDDSAAGQSDADAVREAREALGRANTVARDARQREAQATSDAARARDESARMALGRVADRKAVLAQTVESADAEIGRAKSALQVAFDAGNAEAIASANEALSSAIYRKNNAAGDLAALGDGTSGQQQQQSRQQTEQRASGGDVPGPRSRQWLADHPLFDTDDAYKTLALSAHNAAVRRGFTPETDDRYFAHLDAVMNAAYGNDHVSGSNGGQHMPQQNNGGGDQGSSAGPSNRGGGGGMQGGFKAVKTGLGTLEVSINNSGGMRIKRPQGSTLENMEEGAKICFPDEWSKSPDAALTRYLGEQVKIAMEIEQGGNGGLINGEGRDYR